VRSACSALASDIGGRKIGRMSGKMVRSQTVRGEEERGSGGFQGVGKMFGCAGYGLSFF